MLCWHDREASALVARLTELNKSVHAVPRPSQPSTLGRPSHAAQLRSLCKCLRNCGICGGTTFHVQISHILIGRKVIVFNCNVRWRLSNVLVVRTVEIMCYCSRSGLSATPSSVGCMLKMYLSLNMSNKHNVCAELI